MGCFASKEAVLEAQQQVGQHGQQKADGSKGGDGKAPSQQEPGAVSYSPKSTPVNDRARQYVLGSSPNTKDRVSNEQIQAKLAAAIMGSRAGGIPAKDKDGSFTSLSLPNVAALHMSHTARRSTAQAIVGVTADLNAIVDDQGTINSLVSRQLSMMSHYSVRSEAGSVILQPEVGPNALGFTLQKLIGRGGFGNVYLGEWEERRVAVKVVTGSTEQSDQPEDKEWEMRKEKMAQMEAILMACVNHPHIVNTLKVIAHQGDTMDPEVAAIEKQLFDKDRTDEPPTFEWHIIMEYCDRGSLSRALANHRFHEPAEPGYVKWDAWSCLETLKEVVDALIFLHENKILHGDLKAANVLLLSSDQDKRAFVAKVSDFGLSRVLSNNRTQIKTQTFGTVTHMPPELLSKGILTPSADVFAIGVLMWEVYSADRVFKHLSDSEVILAVVTRKARPMFPADVPARFKYVAERCWAEIPEVRPSLTQLRIELDNLQRQLCPSGPDSSRLLVQACVKQKPPQRAPPPLLPPVKPAMPAVSRLGQGASDNGKGGPALTSAHPNAISNVGQINNAMKANFSSPGREYTKPYQASPLQPNKTRPSAGKSTLGKPSGCNINSANGNDASNLTPRAHIGNASPMMKAPSMKLREDAVSITASAASSPAMSRPLGASNTSSAFSAAPGSQTSNQTSGEMVREEGSVGKVSSGVLPGMGAAPRAPAAVMGGPPRVHAPSRLQDASVSITL